MSKLPAARRKVSSSNYQNEAALIAGCPLAAAMKLLGGRWKPMLVWYVDQGLRRFGTLAATIPNISEKMLHQQLRELERDGLLLRVITSSPRGVEYQLSALGESLVPILASLAAWSAQQGIAQRIAASLGNGVEPSRSAAG